MNWDVYDAAMDNVRTLFKGLINDNAKLRRENEALRADVESGSDNVAHLTEQVRKLDADLARERYSANAAEATDDAETTTILTVDEMPDNPERGVIYQIRDPGTVKLNALDVALSERIRRLSEKVDGLFRFKHKDGSFNVEKAFNVLPVYDAENEEVSDLVARVAMLEGDSARLAADPPYRPALEHLKEVAARQEAQGRRIEATGRQVTDLIGRMNRMEQERREASSRESALKCRLNETLDRQTEQAEELSRFKSGHGFVATDRRLCALETRINEQQAVIDAINRAVPFKPRAAGAGEPFGTHGDPGDEHPDGDSRPA